MEVNTQLDLAVRHISAADRHRTAGATDRARVHEVAARSYLAAVSDRLARRLGTNPDVEGRRSLEGHRGCAWHHD